MLGGIAVIILAAALFTYIIHLIYRERDKD